MFLKKVDMLSPRITLYYKRKNIHASPISGVLAIIAYVFIFIFIVYYFIRYINRENHTIYFFNRYVKDAGNYSLEDTAFFNYIQILKKRGRTAKELDFNKIEILGLSISIESMISSGDDISYSHWIYDR